MMYKYSNQAQPEVGYNELFITFSSLIRLDYHALKLNMWCTLAIGEKTLRKKTKNAVTILYINLNLLYLMFERRKKLLLL